MKPGIYDALITNALLEALDRTDASARDVRPVDEADQPEVLARHVRDAVLRVLGSTRDQSKRVALVNDLLERLASHDDAVPAGEPQQLLALHRSHAVRRCPSHHPAIGSRVADQSTW